MQYNEIGGADNLFGIRQLLHTTKVELLEQVD